MRLEVGAGSETVMVFTTPPAPVVSVTTLREVVDSVVECAVESVVESVDV